MSIGSKLALAMAAMLVVMFVAMGVMATRFTRDTLVDEVDAQILADVSRDAPENSPPGGGRGDHEDGPDQNGAQSRGGDTSVDYLNDATPQTIADSGSVQPEGAASTDVTITQRSIARFVYNSNGNLVSSQPCGYSDEPKTPPAVPPIPGDQIDDLVGHIVTTPAMDSSLDYRMLVHRNQQGDYVVTAAPLDQVETALSRLKVGFTILFAGAVALCGAMCWLIIKRGLRPVDQMVETASAIAGGNLDARVAVTNPGTELGRLGTALNSMLVNIERAVNARQASEDRLRRFVADAAHELRTPLTSLRGYAELHRQGALQTPEALDNAMNRIESEGARMARLVDDLLLLARLDQQRGLETQPFNLSALVQEAADDFRVTSPDRPITVTVPDQAIVQGDRLRLRQVLDNLLNNARLHTPAGTAVEVSVSTDAANLTLTVADHGPGISPEDQARVFERFWRADPARVRSRGGTGLGLAIVDSLVQAHGGAIRLESEPGMGAKFVISLPTPRT